MTDQRPWIALLGWFPPIYLVGLFVNHEKPWVMTNGWLSGNTPIFWWPTRLYQYRQRGLTGKGANMTKEEIDAQTGGLHPAEICGDDCSGCCDEGELNS